MREQEFLLRNITNFETLSGMRVLIDKKIVWI